MYLFFNFDPPYSNFLRCELKMLKQSKNYFCNILCILHSIYDPHLTLLAALVFLLRPFKFHRYVSKSTGLQFMLPTYIRTWELYLKPFKGYRAYYRRQRWEQTKRVITKNVMYARSLTFWVILSKQIFGFLFTETLCMLIVVPESESFDKMIWHTFVHVSPHHFHTFSRPPTVISSMPRRKG